MSQRQRSKILFIILLIILSLKTFAQDNIIQIDGTEIKAKVLEVDLSVVKYKRFDNIEGPTYTIEKSQVFMIQYENGTKDVFNKISSVPTEDTIVIIKDSLADYRVKSHIFVNAGARIGFFPTQYSTVQGQTYRPTSMGFTGGIDIELGNVYYFVPRKMPLNFGVGINFTWINASMIIGYPIITQTSNALSVNHISSIPYTSSLGPQFSFQLKKNMVLDLYFKPGVSLVYINFNLKPVFIMDVGINFRYKYFMIGLNGGIIPALTDNYEFQSGFQKVTLTNIPYNFSYFRLKVGVGIYAKK